MDSIQHLRFRIPARECKHCLVHLLTHYVKGYLDLEVGTLPSRCHHVIAAVRAADSPAAPLLAAPIPDCPYYGAPDCDGFLKAEEGERRSLGNRLVKQPMARDFDSQSTATEYRPVPHRYA
jgi:hypothetical protein